MALLLGAIAGLISLTAVVTGVSVTLVRGGGASSVPVSKQQEKFEPTEKKECTVLLTGKEDSYAVVSCKDDSNTWYLFDKGKGSLEKIKGISTPNTGNMQVGSPINLWKGKNWTAFRNFDQRNYKGSNSLQGTFLIDYKSGATEFPFSEYIKKICPPPSGMMVRSDTSYTCSKRPSLDIDASTEFGRREKKSQYQNAFNRNGESRCYGKDQRDSWKVVNCQTTTHQH